MRERRGGIFRSWWRLAGVAGIIYGLGSLAVLVASSVGAPGAWARPSDLARFFEERGDLILILTYAEGVLLGIFLLLFASGLRGYLARAEGGYGVWANTVLASAAIAAAVRLATVVAINSMAAASGQSGDQGLIEAASRLRASAGAIVQIPLAGILLGAALVVLSTGVLDRWHGWVGLATVAMALTGAAWPMVGSPGGVLATLADFGQIVIPLWMVMVGTAMALVKLPPPHVPGEGLLEPLMTTADLPDDLRWS